MSKQYPNRADWLKVRATKSTKPVYTHISARLATVPVPGTKQMQTIVVRPGTTFNAGRNAEKRTAKRMDVLANRRLRQRQLAA